MKKAIVSVTNDLITDQRINKVCITLVKLGFDVLLVGRKQKSSAALESRNYRTSRMKLFFEKGLLFYAEYNIRLFFFLLFKKADVLVANDLDTLLPNYIISKLKSNNLVYDSHEYFCYVPELIHRPRIQMVWKVLEKYMFPKLKYVFTVNDSIAGLYKDEYKVDVKVVRNIPPLALQGNNEGSLKSKSELGLPSGKKIILLQGAGININRGAEEAIQAMQYVDNALFLIIGGGDVIQQLKQMANDLNLPDKIIFINKLPFNELMQYTRIADIGLTLDKSNSPNYRYSLPNKLFDYIHAGIPVLASPLLEIKKVYEKFNIGELIEDHDPKHVAKKINFMLNNEEMRQVWKENTKLAAQEYQWEKEENKLIKVYEKFI